MAPKIQLSTWNKLTDPHSGLNSGVSELPVRAVVLAAHPDDESIGASVLLGKLRHPLVVYLTDGAPSDSNLWSGEGHCSREDYARTRRDEAEAALDVLGIPSNRVFFLGAVDQESVFEVDRLIEKLSAFIREQRPDVLITHPYEGGHPDHDCAALVASLTAEHLRRKTYAPPELLEMTSYHDRGGKLTVGTFLLNNSLQPACAAELVIQLSARDVARKRAMMNAHISQQSVLADFSPDLAERLRIAPSYDFSKPPHPGTLRYENMGWRLTGEQWRKFAVDATEKLFDRSSMVLKRGEEAGPCR